VSAPAHAASCVRSPDGLRLRRIHGGQRHAAASAFAAAPVTERARMLTVNAMKSETSKL